MENNENKTQEQNASRNYELKSEAVEELVGAQAGEAPEYSKEELERYRTKRGFRIPEPVKILFIKAWFAGAVCFFFLWGLGTYVSSMLDMLFILGIGLGMVTDLLTNNVLRFFEKTTGENDKWMMLPKKGMVSFFLNILYAFLVLLCVYTLYNAINYAIVSVTGNTDTVPLGVEPILFGVFCMGFDMLFIGIKRLLGSIIRDARNAARTQR